MCIVTGPRIDLAITLIDSTGSIPVSSMGPHGLDIDKESDRAFVACDSGEVVVLDLKRQYTVRIDGNANINGDPKLMYQPEKFPSSALPAGGGLLLTPPNNAGDWTIRYFDPSMIIVHEGDRVILHFV